MRIISLLIVSLFLSACGADNPAKTAVSAKAGADAKSYCLTKGPEGSYEYYSCYRNRPAVQAQDRLARTNSLAIIYDNRSPAAGARSMPVE